MLTLFAKNLLAQAGPLAAQNALKASAVLGLRCYHKNVSGRGLASKGW